MVLRSPPMQSEAIGDDICERLPFNFFALGIELYCSCNKIVNEFNLVDLNTRYFLFKTYCTSFYGSPLFYYESNVIDRLSKAWRNSIRLSQQPGPDPRLSWSPAPSLLLSQKGQHHCLLPSLWTDPSAWPSTVQHGPHGASGAESAPSSLQLVTILCTTTLLCTQGELQMIEVGKYSFFHTYTQWGKIKRKDVRRYHLRSPPMQSEAI